MNSKVLSSIGFSFFLFATFFFASCEKIDCPYDDGCDEKADQVDSSATNDQDTIQFETQTRKVLIEDYTGHTCGNCPGAALKAREIEQAQGGKNIVIVGIHMGYFAEPDPGAAGTSYPNSYSTDFRTTAGSEYDTEWNIDPQGLPKGMISRAEYNGNKVLNQSIWPSAVDTLLGDTAKFSMEISTEWDQSSELYADVGVKSQEPLTGEYYTTIYLVEDSVVDWQKNYRNTGTGDPDYPDGDVENYVHRHVLRDNFNGTWGTRTFYGSTPEGAVNTHDYTLTVNPSWDKDNLYVVAYIYDNATKEVWQVAEQHVEN